MKARNFSIILIITLFFSGCVVFSFYPLYTEKDLFPNEILTGEWIQEDEGTNWTFRHPYIGKMKNGIIDSLEYALLLKTTEDGETKESEFSVHIIKLGGYYFLDFYLEDYGKDEIDLASLHIIPVHTFAKLTVEENQLKINWFDQEWLEDLIKENKIRIHHENNDDFILLTAKPKELQKFVTKYVHSEEAFKDGLEVILTRR